LRRVPESSNNQARLKGEAPSFLFPSPVTFLLWKGEGDTGGEEKITSPPEPDGNHPAMIMQS